MLQVQTLIILQKDGSLFDSSLKNASNDKPQPSSDAGKKDDDGVCKESRIADQEKSKNSTQGVNTIGPSINTESDMFSLGDNATATHDDFFGDETEVDMSNITTTYPVPFTLNTRIHKDHSLDHEEPKKTLVDLPHGKRAIGNKWVYRNKKDERVGRIEAIRLFLAYASFKDFVVYQMDVKSAFLYGKIEEEVYVCQPLGFEDPEFPNRVYKRGQTDKTLFIKRVKSDILLVQVYVDGIIFGSTKKKLCTEFKKLMHKKFQMSSIGELTFFLGLKVTQKDDGIFISQDKYVDEILKKFGFSTVKTASTPMETSKPLLKDAEAEDVDVHLYRSMIGSLMYLTSSRPGIIFAVCACDSPFDLEAYTDSDYTGATLDRKSTIEGCQFLRSRLISWQCKKQTIVSNSTTKEEYVFAASCCGQICAKIQALVEGKKVIVTKTSVRRAIQLKDAEGTEFLPNATIFAELERMSTIASTITCLATNKKFNFSKYIFDNMVKNLEGGVKFLMYPRFVQVFLDKKVEGITKHIEIYVTPSHTKKVFDNMKRGGKGFSGRVTHLFQTMMVQAQEEGGGFEMPTVPQHTSTINQPSSLQPPKKQKPRKTKKQNFKVSQPSDPTQPMADETKNVESVTIHSNDPLLNGEDRLKLNELMELCTNLSQRVLDLENIKTSQAVEITKLKERVKKLERMNKSRIPGLKRLRKVGRSVQVVSSKDEDEEVTLIDEDQERNDDNLMFDTGVFDEQEVEVEKVVSTAEFTTVSATPTTVDELTLAQTLIEIKAAKPKAVTIAATTTTTTVTRPKARGVVKDKGKAKMIEPEKPLKKKDQILVDEEIAQRLQEELQVELEEEKRLARQKEEEERLARQKEEEDNLILWDNTQAMMDADYKLTQRLQAEEQGELTIEERSKLFVELMDKRKKHFAKLRAEEIRRKSPTKAQKRNQMYTYLKNMANYKHSQLKNKSFEEIQMLFDNSMKWVDSLVPIDTAGLQKEV
ncbi:putative ribonuclease H-like domain-containing protein [Tanacetum coccineum]